MPLTPGARLGPYEVTAPIGEGGMGQVWRARDTKLDRDVALKILPEAFVHDADRVARFTREARTLATLNHPHIAGIYGLEDSGGVTALVMELVEGEDLSQGLARGPLPLDEALPIARQIAEALEAAHEQGIIHRDLKPANIKVRPDGTVKVLDFGLAKALDPAAGSSVDAVSSPTITSPAMTRAGMILGTAAYMAPEQAKGKAVDKRADVWAFGVVLFEMLAGQRAFPGEDLTDTLAAVVKLDPHWEALPADLPARVRQVLRACLQKDPKQRMGDMQSVRLALDGAFETVVPVAPAATSPSASGWRRRWPLLAMIALTLAGAAAVWVVWPTTPQGRETRLRTFPAGPDPAELTSLAVSPDGRWAVIGTDRLWLWPLDALDARPLEGTEGVPERGRPFWSPDSRSVAFAVKGAVYRLDLAGGPLQTLVRGGGTTAEPDGAWNARDVILFGDAGRGFSRVSARGGDVTPVVRPQAPGGHLDSPAFLPDGIHFLYLDHTAEKPGIYVASIDAAPDAQPTTPILAGDDGPVLVDDARWDDPRVLFLRQGELLAQRIDPDALAPVGDPVTVAAGVAGGEGQGWFSASANGDLLLYRPGVSGRALVWVDRQGREEPLDVPERFYNYARLSPDGTRVALDVQDQDRQRNIWVWDLVRHTLARLTFDPGTHRSPVWTPDGTRIAFSRPDATGGEGIWWQAADGSGSPEALIEMPDKRINPVTFPPDGTALFFHEAGPPRRDILRAAIAGDRTPEPLLHTSFDEGNPEISPDGRWLAYQSDESGQSEVYVRPYPNVDAGRWQISTGGGTRPLWNPTGRELFYYRPPGTMMAVPVEPGATFRPGTPAVVFEGQYPAPHPGRQYSVSPDGRRFLMIKDAKAGADAQLVVVQNWNWVDRLQPLAPAAKP